MHTQKILKYSILWFSLLWVYPYAILKNPHTNMQSEILVSWHSKRYILIKSYIIYLYIVKILYVYCKKIFHNFYSHFTLAFSIFNCFYLFYFIGYFINQILRRVIKLRQISELTLTWSRNSAPILWHLKITISFFTWGFLLTKFYWAVITLKIVDGPAQENTFPVHIRKATNST